MPILKAPPKLIRNSSIQVRVEDEVDFKLKKYAEFIDATPAFVVAESLKMLFNKDAEFREKHRSGKLVDGKSNVIITCSKRGGLKYLDLHADQDF